jgi:hypothetical protein
MKRRVWKPVLLALVFLLAANWAFSLALQGGWARRALQSRLTDSFGRPVEVGRLGFSLLQGFRLDARAVTVWDDPRFGHEYFLRAERLTAGVRWSALARGRLEFDAVSLSRPSLNLVRLPDGRWNVESWLPPVPSARSAESNGREADASRLSRIEVDRGRINFKQGSSKLSTALVGVTGRLDQDARGRWNVDLAANPLNAPVVLQQAGTLRLRGVIAGVSTRLRPAELDLTWEEASLADLSRLLLGRDSGVRGTLAAQLSARIDDPSPESVAGQWSILGTFRVRGVHSWALPGRPDDPSVNAVFNARWRPGESRLSVRSVVLEAPQSRINAVAEVDWSDGFRPSVSLLSSQLAMNDLLAWWRALLPGVSQDLAVQGAVRLEASLADWPLRVQRANLSGTGAVIQFEALPGPIRVGPIAADWSGNSLVLRPTAVTLPVVAARNAGVLAPSPNGRDQLRVEGSLGPFPSLDHIPDLPFRLQIAGDTRRAQDLLALGRALGVFSSSDWTAEGPATLRLAWTGIAGRGASPVEGAVSLRDVRVSSSILNQPLAVTSAVLELRRSQRRVRSAEIEALGARWIGSLSGAGSSWEFDLVADRLDAAELSAWLGPRANQSFLLRMLPFAASSLPSAAPLRSEFLRRLQARGRLRVEQLVFSPLVAENLGADVVIDDSVISLRRADAGFYGGRLAGLFEARIGSDPTYSFEGELNDVSLGELASAGALPANLDGVASGQLQFAASGDSLQDLADSLKGHGTIRVLGATLRGIEWTEASAPNSGESPLDARPLRYAASTQFELADRAVRFESLRLESRRQAFDVTGSIDFARRLNLRVRSTHPASAAAGALSDQSDAWSVAGTLETPQVTPVLLPARERGGAPIASR